MSNHLFLPGVDLDSLHLLPAHRNWLEKWLQQMVDDIEHGDVSSSACLQGVICELALNGRIEIDWPGVLAEHLTFQGIPIAYSEAYGRRLYKFAVWRQTPVHCIHARWWIEQICGKPHHPSYAPLIQGFIQPSNWIYNPAVSETGLRTRMKSEYLMSTAMGLEILGSEGRLQTDKPGFEAALSTEPLSGYLSAEYFRITALGVLGSTNLAPLGLALVLGQCETEFGYCDFSVRSKVDDYMGTVKRTARDKEVHSPLAGLHARAISTLCGPETQGQVTTKLRTFGEHLRLNPLDIPAFRIRDIDTPFGTDLSPLEIIAASCLALAAVEDAEQARRGCGFGVRARGR